jgi:single-strand DNA-binding protein
MASLNKVMLIGNLTRDPEVRFTPKGTAVCDIGLAVNRRFINEATGERQEEVTYLDITLWGRQAEVAGQWLHKGKPVFIEGRLQMDTWEDKATGQKRNKIKVVCENMQLLGAAGAGGGGGQAYPDDGGMESGGYSAPAPAARRPAGNSGGSNSYAPRSSMPQRPAARPAAPIQEKHDDFGEGPITDGLDGDDIPF